jgi:dipeptidyl aminopeptidase/acylaminoacyl peptidase
VLDLASSTHQPLNLHNPGSQKRGARGDYNLPSPLLATRVPAGLGRTAPASNGRLTLLLGLGVVDPDRVGVTGHSHGALMTANLLAHTTLFRAGVATSGSYNKTLTPFGFQNERRSVWKAQSVYVKVSPFFFADKIKLPLLIMHGLDDANPGTTPLQAVKLYEAIRGNGGTSRLVMLPHEPHWYSAMESNEQLAYEELRWFDTYVKNAPARSPTKK